MFVIIIAGRGGGERTLITFLCSYAFLWLSAVAELSNFICIAGVKSEKFFAKNDFVSVFFVRLFHSIHPSICLIYLHIRQFTAPLNILWLHISITLHLSLSLSPSVACLHSLLAVIVCWDWFSYFFFSLCLCLFCNLLLPYTNVATMESSSSSSSSS